MSSDDTQSKLFEVDLVGSGKLTAISREDLLEWINNELNYWAWLNQKNGSANIGLNEDRRSQLTNILQKARTNLITTGDGEAGAWAAGRTMVTQYVAKGLVSVSARAQYIESLREQIGDIGASAAAAEYLGSTWAPNANISSEIRFPINRGRFAIHLFEAGINKGAARAVERSANRIAEIFNDRLTKELAEIGSTRTSNQAVYEADRRLANEWLDARQTEWQAFFDAQKRNGSDAIQQILNTEKAFKEDMNLKSSVQYWIAKSEHHKNRNFWQVSALFLYFVVALACSAFAVWFVFEKLLSLAADLEQKATAPMLLLAGSTILLISSVFWIARIMVKVYFDERYRAQDALERAKMAETYVALTHENLVSPTERAIVLSALFRSTSDSGRSEDSGPEALQQAILARILDGKKD